MIAAARLRGGRLLAALAQQLAHLGQADAGDLQVRAQGQGAVDALQGFLGAPRVIQSGADVGVSPARTLRRSTRAAPASIRISCDSERSRMVPVKLGVLARGVVHGAPGAAGCSKVCW